MGSVFFATHKGVMEKRRSNQPGEMPREGQIRMTMGILNQLRSPEGGWPKQTILELGFKWPLRSGWQDRVVGMFIQRDIVDQILKRNLEAVRAKRANTPNTLPKEIEGDGCEFSVCLGRRYGRLILPPKITKSEVKMLESWIERNLPTIRAMTGIETKEQVPA